MDSFVEALNRLKAVHEQEVLGERAGFGGADRCPHRWLHLGRCSNGQGQAWGLPRGTSKPRASPPGPEAQRDDPEPRASTCPAAQPHTRAPSGPCRWSPKGSARPGCRELATSGDLPRPAQGSQRRGPSTPRKEAALGSGGPTRALGCNLKAAVSLRGTQAELCPCAHLAGHTPDLHPPAPGPGPGPPETDRTTGT